jgi:hypothetical protein
MKKYLIVIDYHRDSADQFYPISDEEFAALEPFAGDLANGNHVPQVAKLLSEIENRQPDKSLTLAEAEEIAGDEARSIERASV